MQRHANVFVDIATTPAQVVEAQKELGAYLGGRMERKRAEPGDDADLTAIHFCAEHETTTNMIAPHLTLL